VLLFLLSFIGRLLGPIISSRRSGGPIIIGDRDWRIFIF
jgi:hypothetical protein